jgi:hypothetical protein
MKRGGGQPALFTRVRNETAETPERRVRGGAKEGSILEQYVDRLSGEPARRQACRSGVSTVAVAVFVNDVGYSDA